MLILSYLTLPYHTSPTHCSAAQHVPIPIARSFRHHLKRFTRIACTRMAHEAAQGELKNPQLLLIPNQMIWTRTTGKLKQAIRQIPFGLRARSRFMLYLLCTERAGCLSCRPDIP